MKKLISAVFVVVVAAALAGCGTAAGQYAGIGSLVGAGLGAGAGALLGGGHGAKIGAVSGAAAGGYLGYGLGRSREREEAALAYQQALEQQQAAAAAAAAAPQEACQWYYDHNGRYQWSCQGGERRYRITGTPMQPLPPPERMTPMGLPATIPTVPPSATMPPPAVQPGTSYIAPRSLAGSMTYGPPPGPYGVQPQRFLVGDRVYGPTGQPCRLTRLNTWHC